MKANGGESRLTDVVRTADLLSMIQPIPSSEMEPL